MTTQRPNRSDLESSQLEQLRSLLAELIPANAFYTRKLQSFGVTFDVASLEDYSARFPFTTKPELVEDQRRNQPFGTNLTYPLNRYTRFHQTSGTSGTPLRWLDTPESWDWMVENWMTVFRTAGVAAGDRVYFAFSFGPFIGFWMAYESAARLGCLCLPGGGMSSAARLRAIMENGATALCCTPTYAIRLGEVAAEETMDLGASQVRKILVAGEPGGSVLATRARIESLWAGARVFDHHGMTEVGPVTFECPAQPGVLHVMESGYYAEIIDPATGNSVTPGQTGELILTTLGRTGSPLLRYRTGDLVRRGSRNGGRGISCACGTQELALDGGILGRVDDMIIVRGVNVYPSAVEEIVRSCEGVAEYQVRITEEKSLTEMRVEIEPIVDCRDATQLAAHVTKAFETALALRVPVSAVAPGALPRFEMKAKRWVRCA
ncbi:MAG: AMP-binding protein [Verrucomicrobia bacterium]|nr:AMP-binding protein [Verrucomicrobiota bacterium]